MVPFSHQLSRRILSNFWPFIFTKTFWSLALLETVAVCVLGSGCPSPVNSLLDYRWWVLFKRMKHSRFWKKISILPLFLYTDVHIGVPLECQSLIPVSTVVIVPFPSVTKSN